MKKYTLMILLMLGAAFALAACDGALPGTESGASEGEETQAYPVPDEVSEEGSVETSAVEKTIFVGPELVECEGEGPQECMLVKEDPNGEYSLHYFPIEGFTFEPGYEYELVIREETVDNPPAGGSSIRWTLVQEVSRTPMEAQQTEEPVEASGRIVTAFVGPELVDCVGVGPQQCMQVKTNPDDDYGLFYDQIEGFEFEEGYEYELSVLIEPVQNPPADAPALRYTLLEQVSKTAVSAEQPVAGEMVSGEELALEGPTWLLESYVNLSAEAADVLPDSRVTIVFEDGQVAGSAGCNNYFGPYEVDGSSLTIGMLGSSLMLCQPEELMLQETAYLAGLGSVAAYEIVDGQLHLLDDSGQTLLVYSAEEAVALTGAVWNVMGYNNGQGGVTSLLAGTEMNALFSDEGTVSGSAGCNDYRAGFETDGSAVTIGPAAATRKLCPEPEGIMEQEAAYLAALQTAASFEIDGPRLDLYTADGARAVYFTAGETTAQDSQGTVEMPVVAADVAETATDEAESDSAAETEAQTIVAGSELLLEGTSWQWTGMTTPVENVEPDNPGQYTIDFLADGAVAIQADCNSGSGTYEADGGAITINITSTTLAVCAEDSLSNLFIRSLNAAAIYFEIDGNLHIDLFADAGTMAFAPNA